ncbi:OmpA family protein [Brenneria corticis]|uniref:OmpA family protein n=1 Tax=Brenneria corticis TaxID=2173106 RepID=A0A2U1U328_9GAMM|nr:OmpA family protein [Brenneria sp. CFCC 11842]PWC16061.1 OmpA family protein [Brenneria sp. CFCC 11842]
MKVDLMAMLSVITIFGITGCQSAPPDPFTPEQVSVLQSQGFKNTSDGWTLAPRDKILFRHNKATLTPKSKAAIKHIASALSSVGLQHARVDGHTDSNGDSDYNRSLSLRRANAVANYYAQSGNIPRSNLTILGLGEKCPVASNNTLRGRAENRRASIIITTP